MEKIKHHISSFFASGVVLVILLTLTALTVLITGIHLGALTVAIALLIACVKGFVVLTQFMHLKHESFFIKLMVSLVFLLFAIVIVITFIDYGLR
jgi:cytochrome c oxidase subunit IV